MYELADRLDPRLATSASPRATYAEMALAGITVVGEFHYLHHAPGGTPYADTERDGRGPDRRRPRRRHPASRCSTRATSTAASAPSSSRRSAASPTPTSMPGRRGRARCADAPDVRIGAAVHSVRAVDPASIAVVAAWAAERGAPLHAHVSEQPAENEQTVAAYGCTPTQLLAERGALGERFTAVHATHVTRRRHRPARRRPLLVLLLPDDRARPRRRHRTGPAPCATPAPGSRSAATPTP